MNPDYPSLDPQVALQTVDNLAVMVLADSGEVLVLNAVGTRIIELMDGRRSLDEIAAVIESEYATTVEDARRDLESFLKTLLETGAVTFARGA